MYVLVISAVNYRGTAFSCNANNNYPVCMHAAGNYKYSTVINIAGASHSSCKIVYTHSPKYVNM